VWHEKYLDKDEKYNIKWYDNPKEWGNPSDITNSIIIKVKGNEDLV
jgi:hypothetical protein